MHLNEIKYCLTLKLRGLQIRSRFIGTPLRLTAQYFFFNKMRLGLESPANGELP